jgi:hypothetical protein
MANFVTYSYMVAYYLQMKLFFTGFHVVQTYSFPYPDLISEIKTAFSDAKLFSFFESAA